MKRLAIMLGWALAGCGATAGASVNAPTTPTAQVAVDTQSVGAGLISGGSASNFGSFAITPGFLPDPHDQAVVSGGDLDVRSMNLGEGCVGWATRVPDYIMHLSSTSANLRVYVTSDQGEDTTLVINAADGSWHCNDDSYQGRNPSVDLPNAGAGQYDIWVGSYQQGVQAHGTLHITEIDANHP